MLKLFNKFKNKTISIEDLKALNELLKTGLSINDSFSLIKNKANLKKIDSITSRLTKGERIEDVIIDYLPKDIAEYIKALIKTMSFSSSLNLALSFIDKVKENSKAIEKAILYPFVLLFVSLTALYLFDSYGLDTIFNMLKSFNVESTSFNIMRIIFRIVIYIFYFLMLLVSILLIYFLNDKNITLFYILICKYFPNSLIQTYYCEGFISLFLICNSIGYKSKDTLSVLKSLKNKKIVSLLAFHLDEKLLEGQSLKQASQQNYYDYTLSNFINIAVYTNDFEKILNDYVILSQNKIKNKMKKVATIIQCASYVGIGAIIIFIYQVLFLPMQAIMKI